MYIIANRDLNLAKQFIEAHIDKPYLTEEVKNQLVDYYRLLTPENAKDIYGKVSDLTDKLLRANVREFNYSMMRIAGYTMLGGVTIGVVNEAVNYFFPNRHNQAIQKVSICVAGFGLIMLLSIGH